MSSQFLAPALREGDEEVEQSLRPRRLDDFVGQERTKEQLDIALQAAKARGEALDHVLLVGPPGLGKTTLATIIREELDVGIRTVAGPALERKGDMAAILTGLDEKDVLFVDEIHRVNRAIEEILYPALEDFRLDIIVGQGAGARTLTLDLPPFTLVGATTRTGLLTTPLRDRFGMTFRLGYYETARARDDRPPLGGDPRRRDRRRGSRGGRASRARDAARREPHPPTHSRRRRGAPRGAVTIDDRARGARAPRGGRGRARAHRSRAARRRSRTSSAAGRSGLSTLAVSLGEEPDTIEDVYEPYLLQLGFIQRTPRGRVITELGREHIGAARDRGRAVLRCRHTSGRPGAAGPLDEFVERLTRMVAAFANEHGLEQAEVRIELVDGSRAHARDDERRAGLRLLLASSRIARGRRATEARSSRSARCARSRSRRRIPSVPFGFVADERARSRRPDGSAQPRYCSSFQEGTGASSSSVRPPCGSA